MRIGRLRLNGCLVSFLLVAILVGFVIPRALQNKMRAELPPWKRAALERLHKPGDFPASWLEVRPLSPSMIAAMDSFNAAWDAGTSATADVDPVPERDMKEIETLTELLAKGDAMSSGELERLEQLVGDDLHLIDALTALAARPEYDAEIWDVPIAAFDAGCNWRLLTATRLAVARARILARDGRTSAGVELAASLLPLAQRHPAGHLHGQAFAMLLGATIIDGIAAVATRCDNPAMLRAALNAMDRVDARANAPLPNDLENHSFFAEIRALKRQGYSVNFDKNGPLVQAFEEMLESIERYPEWMLERLDPDDPDYELYRMKASEKKRSRTFGLRKYAGPYYGLFRDYFVLEMLSDCSRLPPLHKAAAARFHLARLAVAERLAQLDGQPAPAAAADLVPRYLPTEPLDPFTSAPFVRSPKGGFHSVGPDGVDDAATILFDSSKGTTSTGDIFLRR